MKKNLSKILIISIITVGISVFLYIKAQTQSSYDGLPTVPCLDYTKPIVQKFSFTIRIFISGKPFQIDKNLGHDYGNCLHDIYVNDSSGEVFIKSNEMDSFTLGQFFDAWHKTFSQNQIFNFQTNSTHSIIVKVNGKEVNTDRKTVLSPNQTVEIYYK